MRYHFPCGHSGPGAKAALTYKSKASMPHVPLRENDLFH